MTMFKKGFAVLSALIVSVFFAGAGLSGTSGPGSRQSHDPAAMQQRAPTQTTPDIGGRMGSPMTGGTMMGRGGMGNGMMNGGSWYGMMRDTIRGMMHPGETSGALCDSVRSRSC